MNIKVVGITQRSAIGDNGIAGEPRTFVDIQLHTGQAIQAEVTAADAAVVLRALAQAPQAPPVATAAIHIGPGQRFEFRAKPPQPQATPTTRVSMRYRVETSTTASTMTVGWSSAVTTRKTSKRRST
jgi:hypothetical protein